MSRRRVVMRDAALDYASRGIPVLPLHYPLPHRGDLHPVGGDRLQSAAVGVGCSCRDPGCGQPSKHPLGALVPHGVKDATCNRARVLAWWTRHPHANIGLACGHRFDVLDVDGPAGAHAIRELAVAHGLRSAGPLVRTGGGGWHFYLAPTGLGNVHPRDLDRVDWRGRGGYVVAPPSRHHSGHPYQWAAGRDLDTPPGEIPAVLLERLRSRQLQQPAGRPVDRLAAGEASGDRYARAALAEELARVAAAPKGQRNRQLWESTRNLYNLVATGALDPARSTKACSKPPNAMGYWPRSPARPTAPWPPAARSAWPTPAALPTPAPNAPAPRRPCLCRPPASASRRGVSIDVVKPPGAGRGV